MSKSVRGHHSNRVEALHMGALGTAALALSFGLATQSSPWVSLGVSLILLLPPLRIATSVIHEARAGRLRVTVMGVLVLAVLFLSRRIP